MIFHKHHIIPKYAGGSDDPNNLVSVNVAMHAFLHELRYLEFGDKRDLLAAQGLRGIVGKEEIWKHLSSLSRRFKGKTHSQRSRDQISKSLLEAWEYRDKNQITNLGKTSKHKRNPTPGQKASAQTGHPYKRKHWDRQVFEEVKTAYLYRTSYHWGRKEICQKYGLTAKTVENMVKHINEGKTFQELMSKRGEAK
jgi:hypothetical protein